MSRRIVESDDEFKETRWMENNTSVKRKHHMPVVIFNNVQCGMTFTFSNTFTFGLKRNITNDIYKNSNKRHSIANFCYDRDGAINKQFYIESDGGIIKWENE